MINEKMLKYSAIYFKKTVEILKKNKKKENITLQFFQRQDDVVLCGINEVLELLKNNTKYQKYSIKYLPEGTMIKSGEVVLELEGKYELFGALEGIIDGVLSRSSSIATNARRVVEAAGNKGVIFMGDRSDHYTNQARDGYAVYIGGIKTQVTDEQVKLHSGKAIGTMPHSLIQMYKGDLNKAIRAYKETFEGEDIVALVDFNNNVINDSLNALVEFGSHIAAVRVDTAPNMIDESLKGKKEYGVTPLLIKNLRKELDQKGGKNVKIIVSSGLTPEKIKNFEAENTPIDFYGVGSSITKVNLGFTGDAVKLDELQIAKKGREYQYSNKLIKFK